MVSEPGVISHGFFFLITSKALVFSSDISFGIVPTNFPQRLRLKKIEANNMAHGSDWPRSKFRAFVFII